jgi:glycosyltransferase involved in cell wall biosynthesis
VRLEEKFHDMRVIRTWIWPSKSQRQLPRLMCYLSFVVSSLVLGLWNLGKYDVLILESPPIFLVPAGLILGRVTGSKVVMSVSDIWPEALVQVGQKFSKPILKGLEWLEKFSYEHSAAVALTNPGARKRIQSRFPRIKTTVFSNGADTTVFRPELRSQASRALLGIGSNDFLIIYAGLHGIAQGLEVMVDAAERLQSRIQIKFVLIGEGPTKQTLLERAKQKNLANITFLDPKPKKEIPSILASAMTQA